MTCVQASNGLLCKGMEMHRLHLFGMFTNVLLHPHHIIPAVELVATLHKAANHPISQVTMELDAVFSQKRIRTSWSRDASTHIEDAHLLQLLLECIMEQSAKSLSGFTLFHIDGGLYCPVVGGTSFEGTSVGISHQIPVLILCYQIWVFIQRVIDTLPEIIDRRHFVFEGDSRIGDVRSIDFEQSLCILFFSCSDYYFSHQSYNQEMCGSGSLDS